MDRKHVMSSLIESVGYDSTNSILEVKFVRGGVWQYSGVPQQVATALLNAPSVGKYFLSNVRDNYDGRTV